MARKETPEGKEVIRNNSIESKTTEERSSLIEQTAEIDADKEPAKTQPSTKKNGPQKKSAPKKKVTSKKKAAPKKKAMPKKKSAPVRSAATKDTAKPGVKGASSTQTKQPIAAENVGKQPSTGTMTESQANTTHTRSRSRVGVWLSATLVLLAGVAAYVLYRPIDTRENAAANASSSAVTEQAGEQITQSEGSRSMSNAGSAPQTRLVIDGTPDQENAAAPSASNPIEHTEVNPTIAGQPTKGAATAPVPAPSTQVFGDGLASQEPPAVHTPTEPASTLGQITSETYSERIPRERATPPDTHSNYPPQAKKSETPTDNIEIRTPAVNQPDDSGAAGAVSIPSPTNQEDVRAVTVNPTYQAAPGFQQIPQATSSEDKTATANTTPATPMARTPDSRTDFSNQPPATNPAWLPRHPPQMRQYYRVTPRPYGWNNPYDTYGRVMPYSMGPHYFSYRRPRPARTEKTK